MFMSQVIAPNAAFHDKPQNQQTRHLEVGNGDDICIKRVLYFLRPFKPEDMWVAGFSNAKNHSSHPTLGRVNYAAISWCVNRDQFTTFGWLLHSSFDEKFPIG